MNSDNNHKQRQIVDKHSKAFLSGGTFRWKRNQEEIKIDLLSKIAERRIVRTLPLKRLMAVAAAIIVAVGITSFMRFYSTTITVPAGLHQTAMLPDGSTVELNAESSLTYYPFWWPIERKITFTGEGFFQVEKGKTFQVASSHGTTQVLGTSFNIFSRDDIYRVTCVTGKVKVANSSKDHVILLPGNQAEILANNEIRVSTLTNVNTEISWKNNLFLFTATPLRRVFNEIERQYAVIIEMDVTSGDLYTGNFNRSSKIEDVLDLICPAASLKFEKKSTNVYLIRKASE
ncbi:FecR family protein [Mangrovibacterium lignilyticum]|uniref:FecR family protein n=1 Tax=Mangrovibacterium lignilyticum TaxID=2668052 RepID=UPI0013D11F20|nr:FecR family protein [Mangrovibacterium lignilyticum]